MDLEGEAGPAAEGAGWCGRGSDVAVLGELVEGLVEVGVGADAVEEGAPGVAAGEGVEAGAWEPGEENGDV